MRPIPDPPPVRPPKDVGDLVRTQADLLLALAIAAIALDTARKRGADVSRLTAIFNTLIPPAKEDLP